MKPTVEILKSAEEKEKAANIGLLAAPQSVRSFYLGGGLCFEGGIGIKPSLS